MVLNKPCLTGEPLLVLLNVLENSVAFLGQISVECCIVKLLGVLGEANHAPTAPRASDLTMHLILHHRGDYVVNLRRTHPDVLQILLAH